jgi:hypothetical protein
MTRLLVTGAGGLVRGEVRVAVPPWEEAAWFPVP